MDHDAEMDAIAAMLEEAGLIESYTNEDGKAARRLTACGRQVGHALAMAGDDANAEAALDALLDDKEASR